MEFNYCSVNTEHCSLMKRQREKPRKWIRFLILYLISVCMVILFTADERRRGLGFSIENANKSSGKILASISMSDIG